jgi:D-alanyl-D-alanine carboxypeptidase/D-alanyl-D-alanine-endopeptidase (penicillin-binding protein 4)
MAKDPVIGHEFVASLSIAGKDGTLRSRMRDVDGRIRGKTGTLGGVHTLAGYVVAEDGEVYAFAYLVNSVRGSLAPVKAAQDDFLERVAGTSGG